MNKKHKILFGFWIIIIVVFYTWNLQYHFKGDIVNLKKSNYLVYKIDSIFINYKKPKQLEGSLSNLFIINLKSNTDLENSKKWKIILFAHEYCPCTKASITEFYRIANKYKFNTLIIYSDVEHEDELHSNISYSDKLKIKSIIDENNEMINIGKIITSGYVILLDENNEIIYTGGVTPYRAHEGKSPLHFFLEDLATKFKTNDFTKLYQNFENHKDYKKIQPLNSQVFGCSL